MPTERTDGSSGGGELVLGLWAANRSLQTLLIALARPGGLGLLEYLALSRACDTGGVSPLEIGRALGLSSGTMTGVTDRLERAKLIRRAPHPTDRRAVLLHATTKGRRLRATLLAPLIADLEGLAAQLHPAQHATVEGFLAGVTELVTERATALPPRRGSFRASAAAPKRTKTETR